MANKVCPGALQPSDGPAYPAELAVKLSETQSLNPSQMDAQQQVQMQQQRMHQLETTRQVCA